MTSSTFSARSLYRSSLSCSFFKAAFLFDISFSVSNRCFSLSLSALNISFTGAAIKITAQTSQTPYTTKTSAAGGWGEYGRICFDSRITKTPPTISVSMAKRTAFICPYKQYTIVISGRTPIKTGARTPPLNSIPERMGTVKHKIIIGAAYLGRPARTSNHAGVIRTIMSAGGIIRCNCPGAVIRLSTIATIPAKTESGAITRTSQSVICSLIFKGSISVSINPLSS